MDYRDILSEQELEESSGAMFAIRSLMDKAKRISSKQEKEKMAGEMKWHEEKLTKSPYWKSATIKKDYDKFKQDNPELFSTT